MTTRIGNLLILAVEPDSVCELCGAVSETRPYGPKGEQICFDCGMKDSATTEAMMQKRLFDPLQ